MENTLLPPDGKLVDDWIQDLPIEFQDVNEGVMTALMTLTLLYFHQVDIAARNDPVASSVLEVIEQQHRFRLLIDSDGDLDQRLGDQLAVRKLVVSNLTAIVLVLSTGLGLFPSEYQQTLIKETNRIVEQASTVAHFHREHLPSHVPNNAVEFCNSVKDTIKSRTDNLYDLLSYIGPQVEESEEEEPPQIKELGLDKRWDCPDTGTEQVSQSIRRLRSTHTYTSESSSNVHSVENSCRPLSDSSEISAKQLSGSTDTHSESSLFSHGHTHNSAQTLTDSITSDSRSEVEGSSSGPIDIESTRVAMICKKCKATSSDLAGQQDSFRHPKSMSHFQLVRVWHSNGEDHEWYGALLDTGTDDNLISRAIVGALNLKVRNMKPIKLTSFGHTFTVSECVQPRWQFKLGRHRQENFRFLVNTQLFDNIDMIVGNVAMHELGIELVPRKALTAHEHCGDLSTLEREKKQHERQARDATASQATTRKRLELEFTEMVSQQKAAANAANAAKVMQPRKISRQNNDQR